MLYNILIYPLELIIEIVFYMFETFTQNNGIAILGVSIAVTLLSLPLYVIAMVLLCTPRPKSPTT